MASICRNRSRSAGVSSRDRLVIQFRVEPASRLCPIPFRRPEADPERVGGLLFSHAAKETTFDDAHLSLVQPTQSLECLIECDHEVGALVGGQIDIVE